MKRRSATNAQVRDQSLMKRAKSTSLCRYCGSKFTTRGFTNHLNKCTKALARRIPRGYKFCVGNETVFEYMLTFLSNQTLSKLQLITGDNYPNCEPHLAAYCCKCDNDNPIIFCGLCRECESKLENYSPLVTVAEMVENYGMRELYRFSGEVRMHKHLYDRISLEEYLIRKSGSKISWVRDFARTHKRMKNLRATLKRNKEETAAFLKTSAPGFVLYLKLIRFRKRSKRILEQCNHRFMELTEALKEQRMKPRWYSLACKDFVTKGTTNVRDVVDAMARE